MLFLGFTWELTCRPSSSTYSLLNMRRYVIASLLFFGGLLPLGLSAGEVPPIGLEGTVKERLLAIADAVEGRAETQPREALALTERGLLLLEKLYIVDVHYRLLQASARAHFALGNRDQARTRMQNGLNLIADHFRLRDKGEAHRLLGHIAYAGGLYDEALAHYLEAHDFFLAANASIDVGLQRTLLATVYLDLNDLDRAYTLAREAVDLLRAQPTSGELLTAINNLAAVHRQRGETKEALELYRESVKAARVAEAPRAMAVALGNIGNIYLDQHEYRDARRFFGESLELARTHEDDVGRTFAHLKLGATHLALREPDEALNHLHEGFTLAVARDDRRAQLEAMPLLARALQAKKRHDEANTYLERALALQKEIFDQDLATRTSALNSQAAQQRADQEIALLRMQGALQEQKLERNQLMRNSLLVGTILLTLLAAVLANRYHLKHKSAQRMRAKNDQLNAANAAILEQKEALAERNQQLRQLNEEKNEFLGIAAHDLKNPLAVIQISSELLLANANPPVERVHATARRTLASSQRMLAIVSNLLDMNQIETGRVRCQPQPVGVRQAIEQVVRENREKAEQKQITIAVETGANAELAAQADPDLLHQVLDNLLSNAMKFSDPDTTVTIRAREAAEQTEIAVIDQGPGISEADQTRLFRKFARLSAKPTGGENSTGLGLSIVKRLVEAQDGRIHCESEPGAGATFVVTLPRAKVAAATPVPA